jgi:hypothetical protein
MPMSVLFGTERHDRCLLAFIGRCGLGHWVDVLTLGVETLGCSAPHAGRRPLHPIRMFNGPHMPGCRGCYRCTVFRIVGYPSYRLAW